MNIMSAADRDRTKANRLYRLRETPNRPVCEVCGERLLLTIVNSGETTCYKCPSPEIQSDRQGAIGRPPRRLPEHLKGPVSPHGTGPALRAFRVKMRVGMEVVAAEVGIGQTTLRRWELEERFITTRAAVEVERAIREVREKRLAVDRRQA